MQAEEYLDQIKKIDSMIKNRINDYNRWVEIAEGLGGAAVGERVQTSRNLHQIPNAIGRYVDIEREIERLKEERLSIIRTIEKLPSSEYEVIFKLYVLDYTIKEIAFHVGMSYEWVQRRKSKGLKLLQAILDEA